MQYIFETSDTIIKGVGWSHFGLLHFGWLFAAVIIVSALCLFYKRADEKRRKSLKIILISLIILDEIIKIVITGYHGDYFPSYLPLHLCSINIFTILIYTVKPNRLLGDFLYTVCTPAAALALIVPTWTKLPFANIMHWHSFTVHIMLLAFPLMLFTSGEVRPRLKDAWKSVALLIAMAIPVYIFNLIFDTNFMFLDHANKGDPLYIFEQLFGSHLIGFPVLLPVVIAVMFIPVFILNRVNRPLKLDKQSKI